ncbi:hypothetical protein GCM10029978_012710 [Actinoallomurus acanthiterrae]
MTRERPTVPPGMRVCPPYDHADLTVNNARRLIWETFAGLAYKKREHPEP